MIQENEFFKPGELINNKYKIINQLSKGSFAYIYKAYFGKEFYAIKVTLKSELLKNQKLSQLYINEVQILKSIKHQNICKYIDNFEDLKYSYLVLEYCDQGDLAQYISSQPLRSIPEEQAIKIFKQLVEAFKEMHKYDSKIIHREQPNPLSHSPLLQFPSPIQNILLKDDQVKIADFGFSRMLQKGDLAQTSCGSLYTMAPEILKGNLYGVKVDVYSLGVVLYLMLCGMFPYYGETQKKQEKLIIKQELKFQNINFQKVEISEKTVNLIQQMLKYDEDERISFEDLNDYIETYFSDKSYNQSELKIKDFEFFSNKNSEYRYTIKGQHIQQIENYKIKVLGDSNVGKTSIIEQLTRIDTLYQNSINSGEKISRPSTIGNQFHNMNVSCKGRIYNLQIWDTGGQEKFHSVSKNYFKNTDLFLIVFDTTDIYSLRNVDLWIQKINENSASSRILILENKYDLHDSRSPDFQEMQNLKQELGNNQLIMQVSAKTDLNISKTFKQILEQLSGIDKDFKKRDTCCLCLQKSESNKCF